MGTRGLLGLVTRGARHGCYNPCDSYPDGLGQEVVDFILSLAPEQIATMILRLQEIEWVEEDSVFNLTGAPFLSAIYNEQVSRVGDSIDFLEDSIFCEWAYVIDFENQTLETWVFCRLKDTISFDALRENKDYMENLQREWFGEEEEEEIGEKEPDEKEPDEMEKADCL